MTTLNKISYLIADRLSRGNDYVLIEEIKELTIAWRAKMIRQDLQRNTFSSQFYQREVLPLMIEDDYGVVIKRTTDVVPAGVRSNLTAPFFYVGRADFNKPFTYVQQGQIPLIQNRKFSAHDLYYSYVNGLIYIYGNNDIDYIGIGGAFENPEEFANLMDSCCSTNNGDRNFYLPVDMEETIISGIVQFYENSKQSNTNVHH